jgi:hypothetical protein
MSDIQRRIKHNPFYETMITMLGRSNFHLTRPELGSAGSIDLIVYVSDRQQKETTRTINLPAKLAGFSMLQWKHHYQIKIDEMEKAGFRPSRQQFERMPELIVRDFELTNGQTIMPPEEPMKQPEEILPVVIVEEIKGPVMEASIKVSLSTLMLLVHLDSRIKVIDDPTLDISLAVHSEDLPEFIKNIGETNAVLLGIVPQGKKSLKKVPVASKATDSMTVRERIIAKMKKAGKPIKATQIKGVGSKHVRSYLSQSKKDFVQVGSGLWDLAPQHKQA